MAEFSEPSGTVENPKFEVGDSALVPAKLIGLSDGPALLARKVEGLKDRSILVSHARGETVTISSKLAHKNVSLCLIRIGDVSTERSALDPVIRGLKYHLRLILSEEMIRVWYVRTAAELRHLWACLLYTSPSPRDQRGSRMPSSA